MNLSERINAFSTLGAEILNPTSSVANALWDKVNNAHIQNPWFTPEFCRMSIQSIASSWLNVSAMYDWVNKYPQSFFDPKAPKNVGIVMAGNIPFVGFHDILCTLISGHNVIGKVSSKDAELTKALADLIIIIEPNFKRRINITDGKIEGFNAVIATGSGNTTRYFDYYFGRYPNIIRSNRNSLAVLTADENDGELDALTDDIFAYFGLGCRNVSKLLVPKDYNFGKLFNAFERYNHFKNHNKYANNYDYHRAIYLLNMVEHLDNGFAIIKADESLGSPVSVVYYQHYASTQSAVDYINQNEQNLQCVVSTHGIIPGSIPFGTTQQPILHQYADGIDTIEFLSKI